jgi:hypothetical protein
MTLNTTQGPYRTPAVLPSPRFKHFLTIRDGDQNFGVLCAGISGIALVAFVLLLGFCFVRWSLGFNSGETIRIAILLLVALVSGLPFVTKIVKAETRPAFDFANYFGKRDFINLDGFYSGVTIVNTRILNSGQKTQKIPDISLVVVNATHPTSGAQSFFVDTPPNS